MTKIIHAVTVHRPWGYAIAALGKAFENRTWNCPLQAGSYLAIHNGQKWSKGCGHHLKMSFNKFEPIFSKQKTGVDP